MKTGFPEREWLARFGLKQALRTEEFSYRKHSTEIFRSVMLASDAEVCLRKSFPCCPANKGPQSESAGRLG
jgi:hypothetical protein